LYLFSYFSFFKITITYIHKCTLQTSSTHSSGTTLKTTHYLHITNILRSQIFFSQNKCFQKLFLNHPYTRINYYGCRIPTYLCSFFFKNDSWVNGIQQYKENNRIRFKHYFKCRLQSIHISRLLVVWTLQYFFSLQQVNRKIRLN